jgi:glycine cleavage system H protein
MLRPRGPQQGAVDADCVRHAAAGCGGEQNLFGEATTMASYPTDVRYTDTHLWVRPREELVTIGITEFGADQLGAVGFVELPYPGELFRTGDLIGRLRSDTASVGVHIPFVGQINAVNQALTESPGLINSDPYGNGWIARIQLGDPADVDGLMDAAEYEASLAAKQE